MISSIKSPRGTWLIVMDIQCRRFTFVWIVELSRRGGAIPRKD